VSATYVFTKRVFKSQIPLRYPASEQRPATELDSVMEFGLPRTIELASTDRFELSRHVEIARTWS